jgi:hypothetical protein
VATKDFWSPKGAGTCNIIFEKKIIRPLPPPYLLGFLKKFSCHLMVGVCQMVIEKIQLSFDTPHYPLVTKFLRSPKKRACHMFMETPHYKEGCLKKIWLLLGWQLKIIGCHKIDNFRSSQDWRPKSIFNHHL